ncbi:hypothetical protein GCM10025787_03360 [Saccharopolyspora rosea]|uniref:Uncharacterized protein n=1 Tax=Saccharopolyspora rosea TaxID=524884 RepID=A0ABW3FPZ6_9PSEU
MQINHRTGAAPTVVERTFGPRKAPQVAPVLVEDTPVPGLVIAPVVRRALLSDGWRFSGEWTVLHAASGLSALGAVGALGHMREAAALLNRPGLDWTRPTSELTASPGVKELLTGLSARVRAAVAESRPAQLRDTSWQVRPPLWVVTLLDSDGKVVETGACRTYTDAESEAVSYGRALDRTAHADWKVEISRGIDPEWELSCAWRPCGDALTDPESGFPFRHPDRAGLVADALEQGWRQLDQRRVLCPVCSDLFTTPLPAY